MQADDGAAPLKFQVEGEGGSEGEDGGASLLGSPVADVMDETDSVVIDIMSELKSRPEVKSVYASMGLRTARRLLTCADENCCKHNYKSPAAQPSIQDAHIIK